MSTSLESSTLPIFQQHRHAVYGWAFRVLGDHHAALDVSQDVFLKWVEQVQIVEPDNPRAWLRRVTMNLAIDAYRRRKPTTSIAKVASKSDGVVVGASEQEELRGAVANAMAELSEQQRAVLVAKVYDGQTFAAIASELDLAIPTVKTHYLRALGAVRDRLARLWDPKGDES